MQQVLRCNKFHEQKVQVLRREKSTCNKSHEHKSARTGSTNKNQHGTTSIKKISFTRRQINLQVSRREKSICDKFHERESAHNKLREQKSQRNDFHSQNQFNEERN